MAVCSWDAKGAHKAGLIRVSTYFFYSELGLDHETLGLISQRRDEHIQRTSDVQLRILEIFRYLRIWVCEMMGELAQLTASLLGL